ncbi:hypothetical protein CAC42_2711 [Sphaceloma murrayae]|uniref:NADAR domain-containing protein n=1 Tax=Sphaceloma murrayae TaxID=2082308 RepID=A0A2K1R0M5_9PEZI|nr:hypothetical protein CAC42_2711 [Sphaceloma murrayae]
MATVYFWRETEPDFGYLSQWYECPFQVDGVNYWHTEMWMMMEKARLFNDADAQEAMLKTKEPRKHQGIGRKIKGFDRKIWDQHKSRIVEEGNYHKFTKTPASEGLREQLLSTGDRELVELVLWSHRRTPTQFGDGGIGAVSHSFTLNLNHGTMWLTGIYKASPYDRIWGVGFKAQVAEENRGGWGENLLGKAIMKTRERLRREEEEGKTAGKAA